MSTTAPRVASKGAPAPSGTRVLGHVCTAIVGASLAAGGVGSVLTDLGPVLTVALLVFGVAGILLARESWRGSRVSWAFAASLDAVMAVCTLFGAPKVAHLAGVPLPLAFLPSAIAAAGATAMFMIAGEYDK